MPQNYSAALLDISVGVPPCGDYGKGVEGNGKA